MKSNPRDKKSSGSQVRKAVACKPTMRRCNSDSDVKKSSELDVTCYDKKEAELFENLIYKIGWIISCDREAAVTAYKYTTFKLPTIVAAEIIKLVRDGEIYKGKK